MSGIFTTAINRATRLALTPNPSGPPSSAQYLARNSRAWHDVEVALDIIDAILGTGVRDTIKDMVDGEDITLNHLNGKEGTMRTLGIEEQMTLDYGLFPSLAKRDVDPSPIGQFDDRVTYFEMLLRLAATLVHECVHRNRGVLGKLAMKWGDLEAVWNWADPEEATAHGQDILFMANAFYQGVAEGLELGYLDAIIAPMQGSLEAILQNYGPTGLEGSLGEIVEGCRDQRRLLGAPGASPKTWVLNPALVPIGSGGGVTGGTGAGGVKRRIYYEVKIKATAENAAGEIRNVGGLKQGFPLMSDYHPAGTIISLSPPSTHANGDLEAVFVGGKRVRMNADGSVSVDVKKPMTVEFRYKDK